MPLLPRRPLGRTGLDVTSVGLGGAGIGGDYGRVKEQAATYTIRKALASGINLIDVSPAWGDSEALVGKALTQKEREKTVISTKLAFAAEEPWDVEREMEASIRTSLERLRIDHIPILGLHRYVFHQPQGLWSVSSHAVLRPGGYLDCLKKWQEKGIVKCLAFTAWGDAQGVQALFDSGGFDICEIEYSLLHQDTILPGTPGPGFLERAAKQGMAVLATRPLAGGALANKATGTRGDAQAVRDRQKAALLSQRLGGGTLVHAAIQYPLTDARIASVLVGARQPEEIEMAAAATRQPPLEASLVEAVDRFRHEALL
ncbi:MAG TPA: aldo/keto reductase [Candidatus Xenobia bacterium]|jgi:aryl-alcohol dehydrogenase-like predicted oxidoreductase